MNNHPINQKKLIEALLASSGGKIDRQTVGKAASGDVSSLLGALSPADREKLQKILSDKTALQQMLSGDAARKILGDLSDNGSR